MALPTWIPDALRSEARPLDQGYWRCVEAQHLVSTLKLVDNLSDQALLEDILEETKPPVPTDCEGLHWLYMTPFRYGLYPNGSRFRRAGRTPGVYYISERQETAVIETAFHLLLFYAESPATPFPERPSEHTVFNVPVSTQAAIHLARPPFAKAEALWTHPTDYAGCQSLEDQARAAGIEVITYTSVRDPAGRRNAAILTCAAFADKAPTIRQTWKLWFNQTGVHALSAFRKERFSLGPDAFAEDPRIAALSWTRGRN